DSFRVTWNVNDTTEMAAVAVMALLVSHLEGGVVERVLQIGSGGDYYVLTASGKDRDQVEVSGVREDADGAETRRRTRKKADQVLSQVRRGFVSVTAFSHPPGAESRSCLHYVRRRGR
ncbi:MAG TPA: hypothetical protein VD866_21350, partial [Urbifossiella sp.]|nr:hypothetical protein [Urbifossiella sp.]